MQWILEFSLLTFVKVNDTRQKVKSVSKVVVVGIKSHFFRAPEGSTHLQPLFIVIVSVLNPCQECALLLN